MCVVNWHLLLEYIKVILSAPPIAALTTVFVVLLFKTQIAEKIKNLKKAYDYEFELPQQAVKNEFKEEFSTVSLEIKEAGKTQHIKPEGHDSFQSGTVTVIDASRIPDTLKDDPIAIEQIKKAMNDPYNYVAEYKQISTSLNYERIFTRIYGTQLKLLHFLATLNRSANYFELSQFHGEHITLTGNTNNTLALFTDFMRDSGLIIEEAKYSSYKISQYGLDFLSYITVQYPDFWYKKSY